MRKYIRALRLPFITASILPFILGSFLDKSSFTFIPFLLGLIAVISTHLGANLINDYADSKSKADWQDKKWYNFFGGSKLIQEGVITEGWYLKSSLIYFAIAWICIVLLAIILGNVSIIAYYLIILFLGFSYSHKPLQLSYRRLGEFVIFILFGLATVCGGYFIQTQIFPHLESFVLSLPFGFFTTAILYSNEVPDLPDDIKAGKLTWVSILGCRRAFLFYYLLIALGFGTIAVGILCGYLGLFSYLAFIFIIPGIRAANLLRNHCNNKLKLIESSKLTIMVQALVSIVLIIDILL